MLDLICMILWSFKQYFFFFLTFHSLSLSTLSLNYTIKKSWQMGSLITVEYWVLSSVQGLTLVSSDGCQGACPKDLQTNIPSYLPSHARLQLWINQFKKSIICFLKLIVKWFRRMFCSFMTKLLWKDQELTSLIVYWVCINEYLFQVLATSKNWCKKMIQSGIF